MAYNSVFNSNKLPFWQAGTGHEAIAHGLRFCWHRSWWYSLHLTIRSCVRIGRELLRNDFLGTFSSRLLRLSSLLYLSLSAVIVEPTSRVGASTGWRLCLKLWLFGTVLSRRDCCAQGPFSLGRVIFDLSLPAAYFCKMVLTSDSCNGMLSAR